MKFSLITSLIFSFNLFGAELDKAASSFEWKAGKKTGSSHHGPIKLKTSTVVMKDGKIKSAKIVMDMKSIDSTDLKGEWKTKFIKHMHSDDFFSTTKHPTSSLEIMDIKDNKAKAKLTIKGITPKKTIDIPFTLKNGFYEGKMVFNRTDYKIVYGSESFIKKLTVDKIIKDDVELKFKVKLKK